MHHGNEKFYIFLIGYQRVMVTLMAFSGKYRNIENNQILY